jgi:anti-sigma-K factor RskA
MNRDEITELAALYALGGLEGEDRARFEALLEGGDPTALAAVRQFEDTLAGLAAATPEAPPASVKAALLARIEAEGRPTSRASVTPLPDRAGPRGMLWPVVWGGALAAGLAALAVGLTVGSSYEKRVTALGQESATLRGELERQQAVIALIRDPSTQVVSLAGLKPAPAAKARMFWHARAGGLLIAAGLPAPPESKTYQLWAIAGKQAPVSAGVFGVDAKGTGSLRVPPLPGVGTVDVFAVTLEPAGGLPGPSGEMYLAGKS